MTPDITKAVIIFKAIQYQRSPTGTIMRYRGAPGVAPSPLKMLPEWEHSEIGLPEGVKDVTTGTDELHGIARYSRGQAAPAKPPLSPDQQAFVARQKELQRPFGLEDVAREKPGFARLRGGFARMESAQDVAARAHPQAIVVHTPADEWQEDRYHVYTPAGQRGNKLKTPKPDTLTAQSVADAGRNIPPGAADPFADTPAAPPKAPPQASAPPALRPPVWAPRPTPAPPAAVPAPQPMAPDTAMKPAAPQQPAQPAQPTQPVQPAPAAQVHRYQIGRNADSHYLIDTTTGQIVPRSRRGGVAQAMALRDRLEGLMDNDRG